MAELSSNRGVVVAQIGARHHYAIPRMLQRAGYLSAFFTDTIATKGLGRLLTCLPMLDRLSRVRKLSQRIPLEVPSEKIRHTDAILRRHLLQSVVPGLRPSGYVQDDHLFDQIVSGWDFGAADTLYAMQKHGTLLLQAAQRAGLRTVVDVFITPLSFQIVDEERMRFSDMEPLEVSSHLRLLEEARTRQEIAHADLLLCPGQNVVDGLETFSEFSGKAYSVVPYGSGVTFGGRQNQPDRGRVLFAGTADLRKGIHYLGTAARILEKRGYEFRVAGGVTERIATHPGTGNLRFLGRLPRDRMKEEFLKADVFVLPTLAEGCASVVHEAVAAGCPVVTTASAGTLVSSDNGGLIVPERDPIALAHAIERIVEDREYRQHLADSCAELAKELSEERWGQRLLKALYGQKMRLGESSSERC